MPSEKRQRQDEGRLSRLEQQQVAERRATRRRQARNLVVLLGVLLVGAFLWSLRSDGSKTDVSAEDSTTTTADGSPVSVVLPGAGAAIVGETPCPAADGSSKRTTKFEKAPPMCIDKTRTYTATIETTEGTIEIALDAAAAPVTVNNFVVLARYHYYDNVAFHRIIPDFMIQTGDPVGPTPGLGNPGYTIPDELPTVTPGYPDGAVAMANTSQPDTGGGQFFIVVGAGAETLDLKYSLFGKVTKGQDVAREINKHGDKATNGTPTKIFTIKTVTITES